LANLAAVTYETKPVQDPFFLLSLQSLYNNSRVERLFLFNPSK